LLLKSSLLILTLRLLIFLILNLHLTMTVLIIEVLSPFLIILLYLIALFILYLLAASDYLLRPIDSILKYHLLWLDVFDRIDLFPFASTPPLLFPFLKQPLKFFRQLELSRVLIILLLEVLQEHLSVLVVQLVQVNHHLLFIILVSLFLVVGSTITQALLLLSWRLLLEFLELLGDVDVELLFIIVVQDLPLIAILL